MSLQQRYKILKAAGSGSFGQVVHARDNWLDRDVAVKILDPVMALDEAERERFKREAKILAAMSHPNIPSIYDVVFQTEMDSDDNVARFQITFEYIDGMTLGGFIRHEGRVDLAKARLWFSQVAAALSHAHARDVIHRDVNPNNIIIRKDLQSCCLVDFGIALKGNESKRLTKGGYVIGTPGYMSPEQTSGQSLDHTTDIYSLGVCLYHALSGNPVPQGEYKPLTSIDETIPTAIDDLVQRCLEDRNNRLPDAVAFAEELANAFRKRVSLSTILTEGRLGDLAAALSEMDAQEFSERPSAGQRSLIIAKVVDLHAKHQARHEYPLVSLLERLTILGTRLPVAEYDEIIEMVIPMAFDHVYEDGEVGTVNLRRALAEVAPSLSAAIHGMVSKKVIGHFREHEFGGYDRWRLNGVRDLVSSLLANKACDKMANPLAKLRRRVDEVDRDRVEPATTSAVR